MNTVDFCNIRANARGKLLNSAMVKRGILPMVKTEHEAIDYFPILMQKIIDRHGVSARIRPIRPNKEFRECLQVIDELGSVFLWYEEDIGTGYTSRIAKVPKVGSYEN